MNITKKKIDKKSFGLNIYRIIIEKGYSVKEIANFLELTTPRVLYDWFKGKTLPTIENIANLRMLLGNEVIEILLQ